MMTTTLSKLSGTSVPITDVSILISSTTEPVLPRRNTAGRSSQNAPTHRNRRTYHRTGETAPPAAARPMERPGRDVAHSSTISPYAHAIASGDQWQKDQWLSNALIVDCLDPVAAALL
jgi:hypothetical protein